MAPAMIVPASESVPALIHRALSSRSCVPGACLDPFRIREFCDAPFCTHVGYEEVCSYGHATCFVAKW